MYVTMEDALVEALKNERARRETMETIRKVREIGGEETILKLAGVILAGMPYNGTKQQMA